jgi:hypothetical protein
MLTKVRTNRRFITTSLVLALIIHAIFIRQMLVAIPEGGLISDNYFVVFYPHVLFMYCLPPEDPLSDKGVNYWGVVGKIIDAFPASLLYGVALTFVFIALKRICKKPA